MDLITYALMKKGDKKLQVQIDALSPEGRFLSYWDCSTGLPVEFSKTTPYEYENGDYYVVKTLAAAGGTNYIPSGTSFTGTASTTAATETPDLETVFRYDGANQKWIQGPNVPTYTNTIIY